MIMVNDDLNGLRDYATTDRQREIFDCYQKHNSYRKASKELGVVPGTIEQTIKKLKDRARKRGWDPKHDLTKPIPEGFAIKKVTHHYDKEGNVQQHWVSKEPTKEEKFSRLKEAFESFAENYEGFSKASKKFKPNKKLSDKLLTTYNIGDAHIGMQAWHGETGKDYDLKIAKKVHVDAVRKLVSLSPDSRKAIVAAMGDLLHTDNNQNRTMASGHILDVDTRWERIVEAAIETVVACIEIALEKHEIVVVFCVKGNHDEHSSLMLAYVLKAWFKDNSRVEVRIPHNFYGYEKHGKCLLGFTHGHTTKLDNLPTIMAADVPKFWGETEYRHWYTGHVHHQSIKEYKGCTVETLRILAPEDAWAHKSGYRSGRAMHCDVWHSDHGKVQQHIVGVSQIFEE